MAYERNEAIDMSTITHTIAGICSIGIDTKFAILGLGYYAHENADALVAAKTSFLMRIKSNLKAFTPGTWCH